MKSSFDINQAITTIQSSRDTHQDWCEWFEEYPDQERLYKSTVHSAGEQRVIVEEYDNVLRRLEYLRNKTQDYK